MLLTSYLRHFETMVATSFLCHEDPLVFTTSYMFLLSQNTYVHILTIQCLHLPKVVQPPSLGSMPPHHRESKTISYTILLVNEPLQLFLLHLEQISLSIPNPNISQSCTLSQWTIVRNPPRPFSIVAFMKCLYI